MRSVSFASIYLDCVNMKIQANRSLQLGLRNLTSTFSDIARIPGDLSRPNRHSPANHFDYDIQTLRASSLFWSGRRLIASNHCVMCHQGRSGAGKKRAHNQLISAGLVFSTGVIRFASFHRYKISLAPLSLLLFFILLFLFS